MSQKWLPDEEQHRNQGSMPFEKDPQKLRKLSNISQMLQMQKPQKSYDPFKCPPDLLAAIEHGQSQRVCKPKLYMKNGEVFNKLSLISDITDKHEKNDKDSNLKIEKAQQNHTNKKEIPQDKYECRYLERLPLSVECEKNQNSRLCPCCGFEIDNVPLKLNCKNTEFLHLGVTYPLYFNYIKQCTILLIVHFFISSIPSIVINVLSDQCGLSNDSSFVCTLSFLNILSKEANPSTFHKYAFGFETLFNMIFLFVAMLIISIFKIQQKIKKQQLDKYHCSISDFSIFLTSLPKQFEMEELHAFLKEKLSTKFQEFSPETNLEIIKEYKLYDLKEYASLYTHKISLYKKKLKKNIIQKQLLAEHALCAANITDPEMSVRFRDSKISEKRQKQEDQTQQQKQVSRNEQVELKQQIQQKQEIRNDIAIKFDINSNEAQKAPIMCGIGNDSIAPQEVLSVDKTNNIQGQSVEQSCIRNITENTIRDCKEVEPEKPSKSHENTLEIPLEPNQECKISLIITGKSQIKLKRIVSQLAQLESEQNHLSDELQKIDQKLVEFQKAMMDANNKDTQKALKFSKRAIITFNQYDTAHKIHQAFKMTFKEKIFFHLRFLMPNLSRRILSKYYFKNTLVKVSRAPEPTDILWTNIGSTRKRSRYVIASKIVVYFLILVSFTILLLLKKSIKQEQAQQNSIVSLCLSFAASTVVALFNSLLGIAIRRGANYEEHNVQTKFFVSVGKNLTKMFIVNMVISTLMSNMVNYYTSSVKLFPFDGEGLMNDFFFLFITNSYIGSIFNIFDIVWGYRLIRRKRAQKNSSTMTQMEANQLFEGHPIDMALRYANVNKTVLFTASVSPFIPIGVPLSIIGLLITYLVDKYLLLRRYVCKNYLSFALAKSMLNGFKIYAVFFSFGNMLTMFMPVSLQESSNDTFVWPDTQKSPYFYISISGFVVALIFRYFPIIGLAGLYNIIFKEKYQKRQINMNYVDIQDDLADDYDQYHPIFKDKEKQDHGNQEKNKNSLDQSINSELEYSHMFKSIENQVDFHSRNQ